jgi:uncharacterized protein YbjT (DUF2867 family)
VIIFGASSGIATGLVALLAERGHESVSVTRDGREGSLAANALDPAAVEQVFTAASGASAVVSLIGGRPFRKEPPPDLDGNRHLIEAAVRHDVRRFVLVSTIGAGDSRRAAPLLARLVLGRFMRLKGEAESLLRASPLAWTIIRPGHLRDGEATDRAVLASDPRTTGSVLRADVGRLIVQVLDRDDTIGRAYACVEPPMR